MPSSSESGARPPAGQQGVTWAADATAAGWVAERLSRFDHDVGSIVPDGYQAYARVLHPVEQDGRRERWADLARRNGRVAHGRMQFPAIAFPPGQEPSADELGNHAGPSPGSLPAPERRRLIEHLRQATTTPERCWFGVWEGWGHLPQGVNERLQLPNRGYFLHAGPVESALAPLERQRPRATAAPIDDQSPNLWWPEDRAWFVATEVDLSSTYVGGSRELVRALLQDQGLEAFPAALEDSLLLASDELNGR